MSNGQLNLTPAVLSSIYQCNTTSWDDPLISALNPGVQLPHVNITPIAYIEDVGVTQIFLQYVQLDGTWPLGTGTNFAAPPCVQHASLWNGVLARLEATRYAIGCASALTVRLTSHLCRRAGGQAAAGSAFRARKSEHLQARRCWGHVTKRGLAGPR